MPSVTVRRSERGADLAREVASYLDRYGLPDDAWRARGACSGMDAKIFFPRQGEPTGPAISVCNRCPVRVECLTWALWNGEKIGIWGGTAERTRRSLRRILRSSPHVTAA